VPEHTRLLAVARTAGAVVRQERERWQRLTPREREVVSRIVAGRRPALIAELEGMDRGRYAGPVGWVDGDGDGELGIALRCAQLDGSTARLFAGCGVVAGSDPDTEVREAAAKMLAVRDALEGGVR